MVHLVLIALTGAVSICQPHCEISTLKICPVVRLQPHSVIGHESFGQEVEREGVWEGEGGAGGGEDGGRRTELPADICSIHLVGTSEVS